MIWGSRMISMRRMTRFRIACSSREDLNAFIVRMIAYAETYVATSKTTPF